MALSAETLTTPPNDPKVGEADSGFKRNAYRMCT